jgi:hypothetical protein
VASALPALVSDLEIAHPSLGLLDLPADGDEMLVHLEDVEIPLPA